MQVPGILSNCYNYTPPHSSHNLPPPQRQAQSGSSAAVSLDISPETWAAYAKSKTQPSSESQRALKVENPTECKTCQNRRYVDGSDDPSVSFQSPTRISPGQAAAAVSSHESEHVANEQVKAEEEGREVVSQTVTLKTSICPECKRVYVSGGETRTITRPKKQDE